MIKNKKNLDRLQEDVMKRIREGKIKMKPKWYFVVGSFMAFIGLVGLSILAIFLINIVFFLFRKRGPGIVRLEMMFSTFPWWVVFLAIVSILVAVLLLKRYDFSYKKNFWLVVLIFIASIFLAAWVIDYFGINETWSRHGPMRRFYQQIEGKGNAGPFNQMCRGGGCR